MLSNTSLLSITSLYAPRVSPRHHDRTHLSISLTHVRPSMDPNSHKTSSANRWPSAASPPSASGSGSGGGTGHGQPQTSQNAASRLTAPASPGIATGPPWSHPPDFQQFPASKAVHALSQTDVGDYRRHLSTSPTPSSSAAGPSRGGTGKGAKPPQTVADAVAASVGNKKERKRKVR